MDLTASLIAFPKEIRYVSKCTNTGCFNGKLSDSNQVCPSCRGTGNEQLPTSAQDTITLKFPNNPQDIVSLDSLYRTVSPDVAIINWQQDYLDKLAMKCLTSVYSGETYSRENIANTATGENINLQAVYDSLYPLALKVSEIYEFIHYCVAEILDLDEGLTVKKVFSKDFKMRSKEELINDRKAAVDSGADPHVISAIDDDIARLIYVDDPGEFNRYMVMKSHYPFSGLSQEEKRDVIASGNARKRDIVLAANYGQVFDMVNEMVAEGKGVDFWETSRKKQREVIDLVVDKIAAEIEGGSTATGRFEVGMPISDADKEAQSSLRGTVGGVQGIIEIITNVAAGVINEEAAVAMLMTLYGFDEETARKMAKTQANIEDIEAVAKAKV
jgi:hypothetical protein